MLVAIPDLKKQYALVVPRLELDLYISSVDVEGSD